CVFFVDLLQRGHECKATHRLTVGVHLRFGPCVSKKRYRPKFCGHCELPGSYCRPLLSTTVKVDFVCATPTPDDTESVDDLLPEFLEPGRDLWTEEHPPEDGIVVSTSVQWVLKCSCDTNAPTALLHRVHRTAASP
ncbi:PREDICTED: protein CYR61-like, partial [Nicrophorus vespilloides]|uniref:Protein CYR61-like n=1 Tax=Nicrophorus vespilloides TaxID=110193 RepID=A0ABM1M6V9_NICVS